MRDSQRSLERKVDDQTFKWFGIVSVRRNLRVLGYVCMYEEERIESGFAHIIEFSLFILIVQSISDMVIAIFWVCIFCQQQIIHTFKKLLLRSFLSVS